MSKPKLTYFDFSGSRGEECRLALFVAGVDFEDDRLPKGAWSDLKASTPFGSLPVLKIEGRVALQSPMPS
ncbi:MAG: glutathione S-transferase N-terminal domain-containing protein [Myxococcota bacterium]